MVDKNRPADRFWNDTEQSGKHPQLVVYEGEMTRPAMLRFSTTVLLIMLTII